MIEVRMMLHDAEELQEFNYFVVKMQGRRRAWIDRNRAPAFNPEFLNRPVPIAADRTIASVPQESEAFVQAPDAPKATPTFEYTAEQQFLEEQAEHLAEREVTMAQLEEAIKAYSNAKGLEKARALLDEFVPGGRLSQVQKQQWGELYARLTA